MRRTTLLLLALVALLLPGCASAGSLSGALCLRDGAGRSLCWQPSSPAPDAQRKATRAAVRPGTGYLAMATQACSADGPGLACRCRPVDLSADPWATNASLYGAETPLHLEDRRVRDTWRKRYGLPPTLYGLNPPGGWCSPSGGVPGNETRYLHAEGLAGLCSHPELAAGLAIGGPGLDCRPTEREIQDAQAIGCSTAGTCPAVVWARGSCEAFGPCDPSRAVRLARNSDRLSQGGRLKRADALPCGLLQGDGQFGLRPWYDNQAPGCVHRDPQLPSHAAEILAVGKEVQVALDASEEALTWCEGKASWRLLRYVDGQILVEITAPSCKNP